MVRGGRGASASPLLTCTAIHKGWWERYHAHNIDTRTERCTGHEHHRRGLRARRQSELATLRCPKTATTCPVVDRTRRLRSRTSGRDFNGRSVQRHRLRRGASLQGRRRRRVPMILAAVTTNDNADLIDRRGRPPHLRGPARHLQRSTRRAARRPTRSSASTSPCGTTLVAEEIFAKIQIGPRAPHRHLRRATSSRASPSIFEDDETMTVQRSSKKDYGARVVAVEHDDDTVPSQQPWTPCLHDGDVAHRLRSSRGLCGRLSRFVSGARSDMLIVISGGSDHGGEPPSTMMLEQNRRIVAPSRRTAKLDRPPGRQRCHPEVLHRRGRRHRLGRPARRRRRRRRPLRRAHGA